MSDDESTNSNNVSLDSELSKRNSENGMSRSMSKKERYFAEKPDKNIFMKLIHPSYQERNQNFRRLFVEKGLIDENDVYLASYSCAYQREILAQGRLYLTQSSICFHANIIGWETNVIIPFKDIKKISKQKAALIFPNSIQFEKSNGEKYFFASFVTRDKSYQVISLAFDRFHEGNKVTPEELWEIINNSEEKATPATSPASTTPSPTEMTIPSPHQRQQSQKSSSRSDKDNCSQSSSITSSDALANDDAISTFLEEDDDVIISNTTTTTTGLDDSDDVVAYDLIKCPCDEHQGRLVLDCVFPISLQKLYTLLFTENPWFDRFMVELKNKGFVASAWARDRAGDETRTCTYSVALNHAMAPKAVIVNEKQTISYFARKSDGFRVFKETQNSGVPYADNFIVQCSNCFSRAGPNECRLIVHGSIHYKKGVWAIIKGYIEKGTHQGLDDHYRILEKMLLEECQRINREESESSLTSQVLPEPELPTPPERPTNLLRQRKSQPPVNTMKRLTAGGDPSQIPTSYQNGHIHSSNTKLLPSSDSETTNYKNLLIAILVVLSIFLLSNFVILLDLQRSQQRSQDPADDRSMSTIAGLSLQVEKLQNQMNLLQQKLDQK